MALYLNEYCRKLHYYKLFSRSIFSISAEWIPKLTNDERIKIETTWREKLRQHHREIKLNKEMQNKFYVLSMFPYPSGNLHMGHVRVYTISDTMARFQRLLGKNVIHPMGWDAFGLPAENAAIEHNILPHIWTRENIKVMKTQMESLCCSFDWDRELTTSNSSYYKWTQYIFLKLYEAGLVYRKKAKVNWDPVDNTVLADEQIDGSGRSWRSGALVKKKYLNQWFIKTTAFAKNLIDGLDEINSNLWRDVIDMQRHWIGEINGTSFDFPVECTNKAELDYITIFTKFPECIFGASHITIKKDHCFNQSVDENGKLINVHAINPFNGNVLSIYVASSEEIFSDQDYHIAIPSVNEADRNFANQHNLIYEEVLRKIENDEEILQNSHYLNNLPRGAAVLAICSHAKQKKIGGYQTSSKLKDWLISRQRYWGTPIPIIHCPVHGPVPVPINDLPVKLPEIHNKLHKNRNALVENNDWLHARCTNCNCKEGGRRETDTMDTFVDSSWYFLRFLDPLNNKEPFCKDKCEKAFPIDLYIGGKEHATLHLYYARFLCHFLHSLGKLPTPEPFHNILTQGMLMGQSFKLNETGKYLKKDEIDFSDINHPVEKISGKALTVKWEKMSKSKHNGVDPNELLNEYGTDATRLFILFNVAPKSNRHWNTDVMKGILSWQQRIWRLIGDYRKLKNEEKAQINSQEFEKTENDINFSRNNTIKEVTFHLETTFLLNTALSRLQELTNILKKCPSQIIQQSSMFENAMHDLIVMLSPFAPCFAAEIFCGFTNDQNINVFNQKWPNIDKDFPLSLFVNFNGQNAFKLNFPESKFNEMGMQECYSLAMQDDRYRTEMLNKELYDVKLKRYNGHSIHITFYTRTIFKDKYKCAINIS